MMHVETGLILDPPTVSARVLVPLPCRVCLSLPVRPSINGLEASVFPSPLTPGLRDHKPFLARLDRACKSHDG